MKRFTKTEKWADKWFRLLPPHMKLLWVWLCDNCDPAGVIEPDLELASFQIGATVTEDELKKHFSERLKPIGPNKYWLPKFIKFQYGKLSRACPPHKQVFEALEKHGITADDDVPVTNPTLSNGNIEAFEQFWQSYPKKSYRYDAERAFVEERLLEHLPAMLDALKWQVVLPDWQKEGGRFIPAPATYLRGRRWTDQKPAPGATPAATTTGNPVAQRITLEKQIEIFKTRIGEHPANRNSTAHNPQATMAQRAELSEWRKKLREAEDKLANLPV